MTDPIHEIKEIMACIDRRLASDDVFTMRRTMDEVVLAMNLLVGLVEGHRHSCHRHSYLPFNGGLPELTGPMQAMEGR